MSKRVTPHVLIIGQSHSTAARVFAAVTRDDLTFDYFHVPGATMLNPGDFLVGDPDVIVFADIPPDEQVWLLTLIVTERPEFGSRVILLTRDAGDDRICTIASQLSVFAVLPIPFGVEQLSKTIAACAAPVACPV